jgi:hypothetical protein
MGGFLKIGCSKNGITLFECCPGSFWNPEEAIQPGALPEIMCMLQWAGPAAGSETSAAICFNACLRLGALCAGRRA